MTHAHILIWLKDKIHPNDIDDIISAEIPNEKDDPILYEYVKNHMLHGPCKSCKDNEEKKCIKRFPK